MLLGGGLRQLRLAQNELRGALPAAALAALSRLEFLALSFNRLTELPTSALLQQYRIQPAGPKRAAPLVALALRMDDPEAAARRGPAGWIRYCWRSAAVDAEATSSRVARSGAARRPSHFSDGPSPSQWSTGARSSTRDSARAGAPL